MEAKLHSYDLTRSLDGSLDDLGVVLIVALVLALTLYRIWAPRHEPEGG